MAVELKVPSLGESINEVIVARWIKQPGEYVELDDPVVELESDKVTMEMPAPVAGYVSKTLKNAGDTASIGELIGYMEAGQPSAAPAKDKAADAKAKPGAPAAKAPPEKSKAKAAREPEAPLAPQAAPKPEEPARVMPAAQRVLAEKNIKAEDATPTGPGGRLLKEDALKAADGGRPAMIETAKPPAPHAPPGSESSTPPLKPAAPRPDLTAAPRPAPGSRNVKHVRMTPIRKKIAERLVDAQKNAALLTTFNEVDMSRVMELRKKHQDAFVKRHRVKLGFMSFFIKASIEALLLIPEINARIEGEEIVYHDYCDIGVAIGGGKGLVVPVIRNAEAMSFAQIELAIADLAERAGANKIAIEELQGGTFTISNGGIYGSMLSTPIVNPPQSGVLGMHNIVKRAVVDEKDQIVVRPMMYVALTYDHRIVDGRGAVTFLKRIKECIEDPERMLIEA